MRALTPADLPAARRAGRVAARQTPRRRSHGDGGAGSGDGGAASLFGDPLQPRGPIRNYRDVVTGDAEMTRGLYTGLLNEGILLQTTLRRRPRRHDHRRRRSTRLSTPSGGWSVASATSRAGCGLVTPRGRRRRSGGRHRRRRGRLPPGRAPRRAAVVLADERPPLSLTSDKSTEAYRNFWPGPDDAMVAVHEPSIDLPSISPTPATTCTG